MDKITGVGTQGTAGMRRTRGSEADILRVLDKKTQVSRQQLSDLTGLSRSTVAEAVARLIEAGLVAESRPSTGGRGRPAQLLRRADPQGLLLGLDFGHNHVAVALGAPSGEILRERSVEASVDADPAGTLQTAREVALARKSCADKGMTIGSDGVQLLGGHGFVKEHPVERWYRDLRAVGVMEGAVLV